MKKRNQYYLIEKEVKRLEIRLSDLKNSIWSEWTPLDKPYHYGFWVEWDFRDDIKRRDDFKYIQKAFNLIKDRTWIKKENDAKKIIKDPWYRYSPYSYNHPCSGFHSIFVRSIDEKKYESLIPQVKKYFKLNDRIDFNPWNFKVSFSFRVPEFWLVPKLSKDWVTETRTKISEAEKEIDEIEKGLYKLTKGANWKYNPEKWFRNQQQRKKRVQTRNEIAKFKNGDKQLEDLDFSQRAGDGWW